LGQQLPHDTIKNVFGIVVAVVIGFEKNYFIKSTF
jgi:hypothetical protein